MSRAARVDDDVYAALLDVKHDLEKRTGRMATMNDAVREAIARTRGCVGGRRYHRYRWGPKCVRCGAPNRTRTAPKL